MNNPFQVNEHNSSERRPDAAPVIELVNTRKRLIESSRIFVGKLMGDVYQYDVNGVVDLATSQIVEEKPRNDVVFPNNVLSITGQTNVPISDTDSSQTIEVDEGNLNNLKNAREAVNRAT